MSEWKERSDQIASTEATRGPRRLTKGLWWGPTQGDGEHPAAGRGVEPSVRNIERPFPNKPNMCIHMHMHMHMCRHMYMFANLEQARSAGASHGAPRALCAVQHDRCQVACTRRPSMYSGVQRAKSVGEPGVLNKPAACTDMPWYLACARGGALLWLALAAQATVYFCL